MNNVWRLAILTLLLCASTGCTTIITRSRDLRDEMTINAANRKLACQAWKSVRPYYAGINCPEDFEAGFMRAYCEVANGSRGCTPPLPPRKYWQAKYRGIDGKSRAQAWFDGYRHGVVLAEQNGVVNLARIPTSVPTSAPMPEVATALEVRQRQADTPSAVQPPRGWVPSQDATTLPEPLPAPPSAPDDNPFDQPHPMPGDP